MKGNQKYNNEELIKLIRTKDQKAFAYLYDQYSRSLYGIINTIVKDEAEAEDLLQKTFIKIWYNIHTYDEQKGRLYTWMLNIARNQAIDGVRSKHGKMRSKIQRTSVNVNEEESICNVEETNHDMIGLRSFLNVLKKDEKEIIDLAYFEGYTQIEISKQMMVPLGTIKSKIRQAIVKLRELTKKEFSN